MVPIQKSTIKTDLPSDKVKGIILKLFHSQETFLWNMAVLKAYVTTENSETVIQILFKLHSVGKAAIIVGLLFGLAGIAFTLVKGDITQLVGLIPILIIYPLVSINYIFDSGNKLKKLKSHLK